MRVGAAADHSISAMGRRGSGLLGANAIGIDIKRHSISM